MFQITMVSLTGGLKASELELHSPAAKRVLSFRWCCSCSIVSAGNSNISAWRSSILKFNSRCKHKVECRRHWL